MKKTLIVLLGLCLLVTGCGSLMPASEVPQVKASTTEAVVIENAPPDDSNWIGSGKVRISNLYPGARAEYYIPIHNGRDTPSLFTIAYRLPNFTEEGFIPAPSYIEGFVSIKDKTPMLQPRETRQILVSIEIPPGTKDLPLKFEFWIGVIPGGQGSMVQAEMASRWIVSMR